MVKTDLFLTHDWGTDDKGRNNHERVSTINKELKTMGYRTWFDSDRMIGDIATQMATGIENTEAVLVFLTKRYMEKVIGDNPSDNCKLEFNHAVRKKTNNRMVCLVMEERMKDTLTWDGSIGMFLGGKIYIDMSKDLNNRTYLTQQLALLEKELRGMNILPNKKKIDDSFQKMSISPDNADEERKANDAKSTAYDTKFVIGFTNKHSNPVRLYWKDYKGNPKPISSPEQLEPGKKCAQNTMGTHPFIARDVSTNQLVHFTNGQRTDVIAEGFAFGATAGSRIQLDIVP